MMKLCALISLITLFSCNTPGKLELPSVSVYETKGIAVASPSEKKTLDSLKQNIINLIYTHNNLKSKNKRDTLRYKITYAYMQFDSVLMPLTIRADSIDRQKKK